MIHIFAKFLEDWGLSPLAFALLGTLLVIAALSLWRKRPYLAASLAALGLVGAAAPATVGLPIALTNAALQKLPAAPSVAVFPVLQFSFATLGDSLPSWWNQQSGTCASNSLVSDGVNCTDGSDGNSFKSIPAILIKMQPYTVSTLPVCNATIANSLSSVSDATAPTYNGTLTGSGAVHVPVFCDGTSWKSH